MDLPKEFPSNINYQHYIKEAENILYDLGYFQPKKIKLF